MKNNCVIILAAGEGTRMKTSKPKVLAEVLFKPMLDWVVDRTRQSGVEDICVITGHMSESIVTHLGEGIETAMQHERLGTGHAVMQARDFISRHGDADVLVLAGDAPLVDAETITTAHQLHRRTSNAATVISAKVDNPSGYGRILRDTSGALLRIVEERDATDAQKMITEVNSGAYWFKAQALLTALDQLQTMHKLSPDSKGKEYYLTDTLEILLELNLGVTAFGARTHHVVLGANDRVQLAQLNEIARREELNRHMLNGVSIPCADGILIGPDVEIGADTTILPGTILRGKVVIGAACTIGPNSLIENSTIGSKVHLNATQCYASSVADGTQIGPFVRIRPGSAIGEYVHIGNFVEIKNSSIGRQTKISHLSYIGDANVGSDVNVGSGCATVNYTGKEKYHTVIKDGAFIGCNTNLVAPLTIGKDAYTAAGSTVTEDVPDSSLAIARARQINKKGWVDAKKPFKRQHKVQE
ncbi:MAG TPA: bifunctional UDP-N-acetylglucosamine diphosphorylase/glucosamine-1-phosphate N-acetyltransferase GlmU [Clostridia bacterium]|nr:bifunctional UDP-N-acetylglucosamine diphosphorylase/glucosamine-1-phosphate N-acetyltransferase GlmU [Clostridia bacterium]